MTSTPSALPTLRVSDSMKEAAADLAQRLATRRPWEPLDEIEEIGHFLAATTIANLHLDVDFQDLKTQAQYRVPLSNIVADAAKDAKLRKVITSTIFGNGQRCL